MRILWLFKYKPNWNFNYWFHMNFAYILAEQEGVKLKSYGQNMSYNYPKYDLQKYYSHTSIEQLKKKFNFDVIIMDGKARLSLSNRSKQTVLPKNFDSFKDVPKITIEGDFHNYTDIVNWYEKRGVDIILHRHKINVEKGKKLLPNIKHIWFPCSVNKELFDKGSYVTYERNYSDLIDKAKRIIEDSDYREKITEKAIKCINERHTHTIRAQQLLEIIRNEFNLL